MDVPSCIFNRFNSLPSDLRGSYEKFLGNLYYFYKVSILPNYQVWFLCMPSFQCSLSTTGLILFVRALQTVTLREQNKNSKRQLFVYKNLDISLTWETRVEIIWFCYITQYLLVKHSILSNRIQNIHMGAKVSVLLLLSFKNYWTYILFVSVVERFKPSYNAARCFQHHTLLLIHR